MQTFPTYLTLINGFSEQAKPKMMRTEYEDGAIKQVSQTSLLKTDYSLTYHACNGEAYSNFVAWHKSLNNGASWFIWVHPRTQKQVLARLINGEYSASCLENATYDNKLNGTWEINFALELFS